MTEAFSFQFRRNKCQVVDVADVVLLLTGTRMDEKKKEANNDFLLAYRNFSFFYSPHIVMQNCIAGNGNTACKDKFENGVFAPKTDKMFSVHTVVFVSFSIFSP